MQEAVGLFEGAAAFCDHAGPMDEGRPGLRSLRDLVGVYEGVRWDEATMSMRGSLRLYPGAEWLGTMMRRMMADREAGRQVPNVGISADMMVLKAPIVESTPGGWGRLIGWDVKRIERVTSADVVFMPSAGGKFDRILEGRLEDRGEATQLKRCKICNQEPCQCAAGSTGEGTAAEGTVTGIPSEQSASRVANATSATVTPTAPVVPAAAAPSGLVSTDGNPILSRELEAVRAVRLELCRGLLDQRLATAGLPSTAAEYLRGRFRDQVFEAGALDAEIGAVRGMLGGIVAPTVIQGMGPAAGRIQAGMGPLDRVKYAMDRLFGVPLPDAVKDVPRFSGIREAYITITGDSGFSGVYNWELSVLREANEVTTAVMANVVLDSMTKRLVADYQAQPRWWLPVVVRTSLRDMKEQNRVMLNDFAVFPDVAENAAYVNLAWDDNKLYWTQ